MVPNAQSPESTISFYTSIYSNKHLRIACISNVNNINMKVTERLFLVSMSNNDIKQQCKFMTNYKFFIRNDRTYSDESCHL